MSFASPYANAQLNELFHLKVNTSAASDCTQTLRHAMDINQGHYSDPILVDFGSQTVFYLNIGNNET